MVTRGQGHASVSVVIPARNEAANLPHVLTRLPEIVDEVVLVDGHSFDDTIAVALAVRPDVRILVQGGRGKGNALACGLAAATGEIIVTLDADGSTDPAEIPRFVEVLIGGSDFAKGSRFAPGGSAAEISLTARLGNQILTRLVNLRYGTGYSDLCYGYNAFWRRCLPYLRPECDDLDVGAAVGIRVARAGLRVAEVPSVESPRIHEGRGLRTMRDGIHVCRVIIGERPRSRACAAAPERPRPTIVEPRLVTDPE